MIGALRSLFSPARHDELDDLVTTAIGNEIKNAKLRVYADGLKDGMVIVLTLALGQPAAKARPYDGPELPDEFVTWARDALARAQEEGGSAQ